jgi:hypothetical protein
LENHEHGRTFRHTSELSRSSRKREMAKRVGVDMALEVPQLALLGLGNLFCLKCAKAE